MKNTKTWTRDFEGQRFNQFLHANREYMRAHDKNMHYQGKTKSATVRPVMTKKNTEITQGEVHDTRAVGKTHRM